MGKYNKDTTTDPVAIQHEAELKYKMGLRTDDVKKRMREVPKPD